MCRVYGGEGGMYVCGLFDLYVCLSILRMCVYVCVGCICRCRVFAV